MKKGYVKLYRKLLENPIFRNAELLQLFLYCLLKANREPGKAFYGSNEIDVDKGQFVTGRFELSAAIGQKPDATYKRLKRLETLSVIALQSNNRNTLVTVLNWELYQSKKEECNNEVTTKSQQNNNKVTQTRSKEIKNNIYIEFFEEVWKLYPNKKGKGKISESQIKKLYDIGSEELTRCINRYKQSKEDWKAWQQGSTFFNSGYIDYLDSNFEDKPTEDTTWGWS